MAPPATGAAYGGEQRAGAEARSVSAMKPSRESSTTGPDRKMIDDWAAAGLPPAAPDGGRAERLAEETRLIRKAIDLETPSLPAPWKTDVPPALLP
jgi:hypothetical protein